jgi:2-polyprenyl-6-methoxyphenol hydroxylase-like FAD-dependent oxidoreductase
VRNRIHAFGFSTNQFPRLSKVISMVDKTLKWPLFSGSLLQRWVSGKLVILGDAAHAMIPFMSQGMIVRLSP